MKSFLNLPPAILLLPIGLLPLSAQFVVGTGSPINPGCVNRALAVGTGDFHSSGHLDLAITCDASGSPGSARVFPGNGTGTFGAASTTATGVFPTSLAVADFNGDGNLDLAVVNQTDATVDVYQGDGAGGFTLQVSLGQGQGIGQNPVFVTAADINSSGQMDLVVVSQSDATVSVLLNNGSFSFFLDQMLTTSGTNPGWATAVYNIASGLQDIAVADNGSSTMDIFQNFGEDGFSSAIPYAAGANPTSVVTGDFNGDGLPDLAVTNGGASGTTVTVFFGDGMGDFGTGTTIAGAGTGPTSIVTGDFNNDGNLDLAMADQFATGATVAVLLGNGSGGFAPAPGSPYTIAGQQATSIVAGDFNGDRRLDLAVTTTSGINVLLNTELRAIPPALTFTGSSDPNAPPPPALTETIGALAGATAMFAAAPTQTWLGVAPTTGSTAAPVNVTVTASPNGLAAGTHLAAINITAPNHFGTSIPVTFNLIGPSGILLPASGSPFALDGIGPQGIVAGDFNNDGIPDLAIADQTSGVLSIFQGDGSGGFTPFSTSPIFLELESGPLALAVGDFDGDGLLDLAFVDGSDPFVFVLQGDGTGNFFPAGAFQCGPAPQSLAIADFNGDGIPDIVCSNTTLLLGDGQGNFAPAPAVGLQMGSTDPVSVAVGDFNSDGLPDIAVVDAVNNNLSIFLNNGLGGFTAPSGSPYMTGSAPSSVAVADLNRDGNLDIVVANGGAATVSVFLGSGAGGFTAAIGSPYSVDSAAAVLVTDINGDGYPDLVAVGPSGTASILLGNSTGAFVPSPGGSIPAGFGPYFAVAGDFNNDGRQDLAFSDNSANNITVALGASAPTQNTLSTSAPASVPVGTPIPLMAQLADMGPAFQTPTGMVKFNDGATTVNTATLAAGTAAYSAAYALGSHTFTAVYAGDNRSLASTSNSVTVMVTAGSIASSPPSVFFTLTQPTTTLPDATLLSITGASGPLSLTITTASGGNWLSASSVGTAVMPSVSVSLTSTALSLGPGAYSGSITIQSSPYQVVVPVNLTVLASFGLLPTSLSFAGVTGNSATPSQTFTVSSPGGALPFSVATTPNSGWLTVSPLSGTTPSIVTVSVDTSFLSPGVYTASINVSSPFVYGGGALGRARTLQVNSPFPNGTVTIPVSVQVLAQLSANPSSLSFSAMAGQSTTASQSVMIGGSAGYLFSAQPSASWIVVSPTSGTVPSSISISANPSGLAAGSYSGSVAISGSGEAGASISVALTVSPALVVVTGSGNGDIFLMPTATAGQFTASTNIVSNVAGAPFTASATGPGGLAVSPSSGTLPATLFTNANGSQLSPGTYTGSVILNIPGATPPTQNLMVSFTVTAPQPPQVMTQAPGLTFSVSSTAPMATRAGGGE